MSHNLGRSSGHHRWIRNNPFPSWPVFSCPSWAGKSRKENPQKLTQLSSRSHPRHLVGNRPAQKDTIRQPNGQSPFLFTLWYCLPTSSSVCLFLFFLSPCTVGLSLLNQKTLRHGQTILAFVSCPGSGVRHILQWLLRSFCEPPHW